MSYQIPEQYVKDFIEKIIGELGIRDKREEVTVRGIRLWVDYQYGKILVEAEAPGKIGRGVEQLKKYMRNYGYNAGLLIDIPTEQYYKEYPEPYVGRVGFKFYLGNSCIYERSYERGELAEAERELKVLLKVVHGLSIATQEPKPEIVLDKVRSILGKWEGELLKFVSCASERVKTYMSVWRRNMELVYGREVLEGIAGDMPKLFVELSIYVTMLKVLGVTVLECMLGGGRYTVPIKLSQEGSKASIELFWERRALSKYNINYLFERDEYDWVFDPQIAGQLDGFFKDLGKELFEVDWSRVVGLDLLKRVYQNIVSSEMRRQLGEFYTPDWIAKIILWRALHILVNGSSPHEVLVKDIDGEIVELIDQYYKRYGSIPSFIDPTCGSFTFGVQYLNALVNWYYEKKLQKNPVDFAHTILQKVMGIDLNPVATISAKVNYLLQVYNLLKARNEYLVEEPMIPIYRLDLTALHEVNKLREGVTLDSFFGASDENLIVYIPLTSLGLNEKVIAKLGSEGVIINHVEKLDEYYIKLEISKTLLSKASNNVKLHRAFIALPTSDIEGIEKELGVKLNEYEKSCIKYIVKVISALERYGRDHIWLSLVINYLLAVLATQNKFTLVLGNLPWVNTSKYPESYRKKLGEFAKELDVNPPKQAATKLDISIILFTISTRYLLSENGVIALMVPVSIFRGLHGAKWRDFTKEGLKVIECFDLEKVQPFEYAENQPGIVFASRVR